MPASRSLDMGGELRCLFFMIPYPVSRVVRLVGAWAFLSAGSLSLAGAGPAVVLPAKEKLHLFLLAGQSNMAGRGAVKDLGEADAKADGRILALNRDGAWQPAVDPLHWDKAGSGVGPGKAFALAVAAKTPGVTIGLIPTACGGSPISTWEPGKSWDQTNSNPWDDAMVRAKQAMKDGTLKAILWHQGESDSSPKLAAVYEEKLTALIARFRAELNAPNLPFIIGQLGKFEAEGAPWNEGKTAVDRAQQAVAAKVPNVYFVSAEGLGSKGDKLHFSTASAKTLGQRYAEAYLKATGGK